MAKVAFQTKSGEKVSFRTKKKTQSGKTNKFSRYVAKNIGKFHAKGLSPNAAMRAVAREYNKKG